MSEVYDSDGNFDLTILLPAYNEEEAIGGVIDEIRGTLRDSRQTWEILVVDDGSTDRTAQAAANQAVRVVHRVENSGYGAAVKFGVTHAKRLPKN